MKKIQPVMEVHLVDKGEAPDKLCTVWPYKNHRTEGKLQLSKSGIGWIPYGEHIPCFDLKWAEVKKLMEDHQSDLRELLKSKPSP